MTRVAGYGVWTDRVTGGVMKELDTVQCQHCQEHIFVKPGTAMTVYLIPDKTKLEAQQFNEEPGAWCRQCNGPVCLKCHEIGVCDHFMKKIERSETATAMRDIRARLGHFTVIP